ncbi:MAG: PspC domain-containing protein [Chlorobi bacterium]|nr:PspC domain-containing protein [Chlorobiota bacterium]
MKKTINININGISFILDEDAYKLLNDYLRSIKGHFKNRSGSDEIISDIEARIAELFQQMLSETKQVLNIEDIRKVQDRLGQTSDFDSESEEETVYEARPPGSRKRLFRDINDRMIGGVCSGLGAYLNIDTSWVRLAFVIALISGVSPLAYIILWIVMPVALTEAERREMHGGAVNISNIEKTIREELNEIRNKVDDLAGQARDKFKRKK